MDQAVGRQKIMKVSIKKFIETGYFGSITLGSTRTAVLEQLGMPSSGAQFERSMRSKTWKYGCIQFHFTNDIVTQIYANNIRQQIDGGNVMQIDPWIMEDNLAFNSMLAKLDNAAIQYRCLPHFPYNDAVGIQAGAGVYLLFLNRKDTGEDARGMGLDTILYAKQETK